MRQTRVSCVGHNVTCIFLTAQRNRNALLFYGIVSIVYLPCSVTMAAAGTGAAAAAKRKHDTTIGSSSSSSSSSSAGKKQADPIAESLGLPAELASTPVTRTSLLTHQLLTLYSTQKQQFPTIELEAGIGVFRGAQKRLYDGILTPFVFQAIPEGYRFDESVPKTTFDAFVELMKEHFPKFTRSETTDTFHVSPTNPKQNIRVSTPASDKLNSTIITKQRHGTLNVAGTTPGYDYRVRLSSEIHTPAPKATTRLVTTRNKTRLSAPLTNGTWVIDATVVNTTDHITDKVTVSYEIEIELLDKNKLIKDIQDTIDQKNKNLAQLVASFFYLVESISNKLNDLYSLSLSLS